jgi:hypothetical protein
MPMPARSPAKPHRVLFLVTGGEKAGMLVRLLAGDVSIPAGRVRAERSVVLADRAAAEQVQKKPEAEVA